MGRSEGQLKFLVQFQEYTAGPSLRTTVEDSGWIWGNGIGGTFINEEEFLRNALFDWVPVETDEGGSDVLPGLGVGEHPGSLVLHILDSVQEFTGTGFQYSIPDRKR